MNNTHYLLINEENDAFAVIKKDEFKDRIIPAIEDETGAEVECVTINEIEHNSFKVTAKLIGHEVGYELVLRPIWEY